MNVQCEDLQVSNSSIVLNSLLLPLIPVAWLLQWKSLTKRPRAANGQWLRPFVLDYFFCACWFGHCITLSENQFYPLADCIAKRSRDLRGHQLYGALLGEIQSCLVWLCSVVSLGLAFRNALHTQQTLGRHGSHYIGRRFSLALRHGRVSKLGIISVATVTLLLCGIAHFATYVRLEYTFFDGRLIFLGAYKLVFALFSLFSLMMRIAWDVSSHGKMTSLSLNARQHRHLERPNERHDSSETVRQVDTSPAPGYYASYFLSIGTNISQIFVFSLFTISWGTRNPFIKDEAIVIPITKASAEVIMLVVNSSRYLRERFKKRQVESGARRDERMPLIRG